MDCAVSFTTLSKNESCSEENYRTYSNPEQTLEECAPEENSLQTIIHDWALEECNVPKLAVTRLLKKLHIIDTRLPKSFKTLLPTPKLAYRRMHVGLYVHLPNWMDALKDLLQKAYSGRNGSVYYCLIINIDGLPIFKSPDYKIYLILCSVYNTNSRPICCGIYGTEKATDRELPPPAEYLADFLRDIEYLGSNPIIFSKLTCIFTKKLIFACDSPIRSCLKKIKSHSGYHSCERCTIKGVYDSHAGHVCLLGSDAPKRTHSDFVQQNDTNHHCGTSVLINYEVDMIYSFALNYMHISCLGVMKRQLSWWAGAKRL